MVKHTHGFSKKKKKPLYAFADSSSKAKTEIKNKPNLKKKNLISHQWQRPTNNASASNSSNAATANSAQLELQRTSGIRDRSCLAWIPSSPRSVAQQRRPSGLPAPSRYFIFTLYFSFFLSYNFGLMGLLWSKLSIFLCLYLKTEMTQMRLSLSLSDSLSFSLKFEI